MVTISVYQEGVLMMSVLIVYILLVHYNVLLILIVLYFVGVITNVIESYSTQCISGTGHFWKNGV